MPMMRDDVEVVAGDHQRQQRADAGRRQGREDRDRVDEALVQHAQHDVDRDDRRQDQQQLVATATLWNAERRALEGGDRSSPAGRCPVSACRIASTAAPSEAPGARLKEIVVAGNWPRWLICSGAGCVVERGDRRQRHLPGGRRRTTADRSRPAPSSDCLQRRIGLQDHAVLVRLGVDGRDDALAERVVQRVVDRRRRDAEARRGRRGRSSM